MALIAAMLCPASARADMGMPGFKRPSFHVIIDNTGDYPDYDFYLVSPRWLEHAEHMPKREECWYVGENGVLYGGGWSRWRGVERVVMAVPRQYGDWKEGAPRPPGVLHSSTVQKFTYPGETTILYPFDDEVAHLRVQIADGQLTVIRARLGLSSNSPLSWLPALFFSAAVAGFGLWVARRWRRPHQAGLAPQAQPPEIAGQGLPNATPVSPRPLGRRSALASPLAVVMALAGGATAFFMSYFVLFFFAGEGDVTNWRWFHVPDMGTLLLTVTLGGGVVGHWLGTQIVSTPRGAADGRPSCGADITVRRSARRADSAPVNGPGEEQEMDGGRKQ